MVDQESGSYRARRAFIEPEPEPTPPPPPPAAAPSPVPPPSAPSRPAPSTPARPTPRPRVPPPAFDDEDAPKPLYRDEYRSSAPTRDEPTTVRPGANGSGPAHPSVNGVNGSASKPPDEPYGSGSDDTAIRSFTFTPRTRRSGEETTTILARTGSSARGAGTADPDDLDVDEERSPIGERAKWGLAIGVTAAVVILGLAIMYAVLGLGDGRATAPPAPSLTAGSVGPAPTGATDDPAPTTGGPLLDDALMLTAAQAEPVDDGRSWKETSTQKGASEDGPVPACFGAAAEDGQPISQQKILRVLESSGRNAPKALHDATAYGTPEEAATAYTAATKTLGTCAAAGAWIESGRGVRGVGDAAVGAVVAVTGGGKATEWHSVVIARTGRVLNVLDASQPGRAVDPAGVAKALGAVVDEQCGPASGACADGVSVRNGPPPLGGDQPGFPAVGDLPAVAGSVTPWSAAPTDIPKEDFPGSSCENVNWVTIPAEDRTTRVYAQPDSGSAYFGVDVILLTTKDEKAATATVERIKKNLETCKDRRLTATVSKPARVTGPGARGVEVTGYTTTVNQKGTDGSSKFRVGIVRAGTKVAYTFANPQGDFDFTDAQWNVIAVRAGQRATQIN